MKQIYILIILFSFNTIAINAQATDYITGLDEPIALYIHETDLFYTENNGDVSMVDLTHSSPIPIIIASGLDPTGVGVYGTDLYIGDRGELASTTDGKIFKIDLTSNDLSLIEVASVHDCNYLVIHQNYMFFSGGGIISKIDLTETNPTPTTVISSNDFYFGVAVYENDLYYSKRPRDENIFTIYKIDITDNSPSPIIVLDSDSGYTWPLGLRTIGSDLFLSDIASDKIFKANLTEPFLTLEEVVSNIDGAKDCMAYNNALYMVEINGDKISVLDNFDLGIEEFSLRNQIKISPNPVKDYLNISNLTSNVGYKIINQTGQNVLQGKTGPNEKINVKNLAIGLYLLVLNNGNSKKFVKMN